MKISCSHCGQNIPTPAQKPGAVIGCPSCGYPVRIPGGKGRIATIVTAVCILLMLLLLLLFLARPTEGLAHGLKQAVFGTALANAADGMGEGDGEGDNDGDGQGEDGEGEMGSESENGEASESMDGGQNRMENPSAQEQNVALADQAANSIPDKSIGFLRKMFGMTDTSRTQAGVGGTDDPTDNMGNTNQAPDMDLAANLAAAMPMEGAREGNAAQPNNMAPTMSMPSANSSMTNTIMLSDSFERRLAEAGARSGDVRISLMWNNRNDLDLHVVDPRGEEINYGHRQSRTGGILDIDKNATFPLTREPVENVYWPTRGAPPGRYRVYVNHYSNQGDPDPTQFTVRVLVHGRTFDIDGALRFREPRKLVYEFEVTPGMMNQ